MATVCYGLSVPMKLVLGTIHSRNVGGYHAHKSPQCKLGKGRHVSLENILNISVPISVCSATVKRLDSEGS